MGLFGKMFGKDDKKKSCCCDIQIEEVTEEDTPCCCEQEAPSTDAVVLTVMGPGCKKCHQLNASAEQVATKLGGSTRVEYITDPAAMANAGVISTPALLIDGKIVSQGRVLTASEIAELL